MKKILDILFNRNIKIVDASPSLMAKAGGGGND